MVTGSGLFALLTTALIFSSKAERVKGLRRYASISVSATSETMSRWDSAVTIITGISLIAESFLILSSISTPFMTGMFQSIMAISQFELFSISRPSFPFSANLKFFPIFKF